MTKSHVIRSVATSLAAMSLVASQVQSVRADAAGDKALAIQMFKDGKTLMNAGNYKDACPKFEASAKLDPSADGTVLNEGLCFEGLGRLATAWAFFNETIARAKKSPNPGREQMARDHLAALEPKLSYVTIQVGPDARVDGLVVAWDGKPLDEAIWNTPFPTDPGTHHLAVSAPGHATWTTDVEVGQVSDKKTIDVPKLEGSKAGVVAPTGSTGTAATTASSTNVGDTNPSPRSNNTLAWVFAGTGVAMIGATVFARIEVGSALDDRHSQCAAEVALSCDDVGSSKVRTWEAVSFITGGLAAASIGASIYFFVSSPKSESAPASAYVRVVPTASGFQLQGAF